MLVFFGIFESMIVQVSAMSLGGFITSYGSSPVTRRRKHHAKKKSNELQTYTIQTLFDTVGNPKLPKKDDI